MAAAVQGPSAPARSSEPGLATLHRQTRKTAAARAAATGAAPATLTPAVWGGWPAPTPLAAVVPRAHCANAGDQIDRSLFFADAATAAATQPALTRHGAPDRAAELWGRIAPGPAGNLRSVTAGAGPSDWGGDEAAAASPQLTPRRHCPPPLTLCPAGPAPAAERGTVWLWSRRLPPWTGPSPAHAAAAAAP